LIRLDPHRGAMGAIVATIVIALAAGAFWRSPERGDSAPLVRWITLLACIASALAWGLVFYVARLPNGPSPVTDLGVVERVLAVREGNEPTAWAYAGGDLVRVALPDWRVLARVPARDLTFQTAAWDGRALLVTFVDGRRGRAMIEGWGLLGDAGWIAPPTDAASAYSSLSAFWDPRDRAMYLAELGAYTDRGGGIARPMALSTVNDKGERTPVSSTFVHAVETRACRSGGDLWLTTDQPQEACRVVETPPQLAPGTARACELPTEAPPSGGLLCASVLSNVVPGAVLAPEGRVPVSRPPSALVADPSVALRASLRLRDPGGTMPDFTWWSPAPDVIHSVKDGWLRFSARSVRGDRAGMAARLLDPSGQNVRAEAAVFDMAQVPAHVFVIGDEVVAVGITPVSARFRLPSLARVDRPAEVPRVRARIAASADASYLVEGGLAVLLAAPPLLLIALLCTAFRGGLPFAKRVSLIVLVAAPALIEIAQRLWSL
jgi:hypothetical protein